jgi:hypothetical protein
VLDRGGDGGGDGGGDDLAWLRDRTGTYLRVHGQPGAARPLLERALAIDEAAYGPDHPTVAVITSNLAEAPRTSLQVLKSKHGLSVVASL